MVDVEKWAEKRNLKGQHPWLPEVLRSFAAEVLKEAADACKKVADKSTEARDKVGNCEEGRKHQQGIWVAFTCEQLIRALADAYESGGKVG